MIKVDKTGREELTRLRNSEPKYLRGEPEVAENKLVFVSLPSPSPSVPL